MRKTGHKAAKYPQIPAIFHTCAKLPQYRRDTDAALAAFSSLSTPDHAFRQRRGRLRVDPQNYKVHQWSQTAIE